MAIGIPFKVSVDNLSVSLNDPAIALFAGAVEDQFAAMMIDGLPHRAEVFRQTLSDLSFDHNGPAISGLYDDGRLPQVS